MRWRGIIVFGIIFIIIAVFGFVFADGMIKNNIESLGSKIIGAQVEIARFQLSFLKLFLQVSGLQVASTDNEFQNLIEIKDIRFKMDWPALLEKKIVINEMAVDCIMRNTKRTTSGKIETAPEPQTAEQSATAKMIQDEINSIPIVQMSKEKVNVEDAVNQAKLATPPHITKTEAELDAKSQSAEQAINNLNITPRLAEIKKQIDSVDLKEKNPAKLKKELKKLVDIKKDVDQLKDELAKTDKTTQMDFNNISGAIKNIDNLKEQDYLNIINSISGAKDLNKDDIAKMLFGEVWLGRMTSVLYWLNIAKSYMPVPSVSDAEKQALLNKKRFKGIDVEFPRDHTYPGFLLKVASITTSSDELKFSGKAEGFSSNPRLYGQPATISMKGTVPDFDLEAILDHTKSISHDSAILNIRNLDIKGVRLTRSSSSLLPSKVASGTANVEASLTSEGDKMVIVMNILPKNLVFAPEDISPDEMAKQIAQTISTTKDLKITGIITMEKGRMTFKINSTVDDIVIGAVKKMADAKAEEVKKAVRQKLDQSIDPQKDALLKKFQSKKGSIDGLTKGHNEAINDTAKQAKEKK
ncbi:MAG TPA: TIGR03545 family protein [Planctomycetota bacterium]|nr:TIGR03545 family protein [Planctomycetota bacterium]